MISLINSRWRIQAFSKFTVNYYIGLSEVKFGLSTFSTYVGGYIQLAGYQNSNWKYFSQVQLYENLVTKNILVCLSDVGPPLFVRLFNLFLEYADYRDSLCPE